MSEQVYDVPVEWAKRAFIDDAKYKAMYERSIADPNGFWGEHGKRIDWIKPYTKVKNTSFDPHHVSIKWFEDGVTNVAQNCIDRHLAQARRPGRHHLGRRRSQGRPQDHLSRAARRGVPLRQRAQGARRQEGRPRHHLPADDPRGGVRDARLRAHRRRPFGGVRRLLAGFARRPHRGCEVGRRHHRRRRSARRPQGAAQGECRRRRRPRRQRHQHGGGAPHRRARRHEGRARRLLRRDRQDRAGRVPVRADERRGSAVHPLHLGLDRQAEGRAPHHRRLSRVRVDDAPIRVRLSRRRHLLVHRRRRLGHRPQLHRLRPARERRHHADVRGRAQLPDQFAVLGGDRQAQGQHLLHRADRDPRADAGGRRAGEEDLARDAAPARHASASRSIRKPGSGTTASSATGAARSSTPGGRPRPAAF